MNAEIGFVSINQHLDSYLILSDVRATDSKPALPANFYKYGLKNLKIS